MSDNSGQDKLRPVIIGFNALIYVMFIVLLILYFIIPDPEIDSSCTSVPSTAVDSRSLIAVLFKVLPFCFILLIIWLNCIVLGLFSDRQCCSGRRLHFLRV
jgi:hypothetical protein